MANIQQCDGCGKVSPNERNEFIANHWFTVSVERSERLGFFWGFNKQEFLLCEDCMGLGEHSGAVKKWLDKLHTTLRRWFGNREEVEVIDT
jgi:hypothetical protein